MIYKKIIRPLLFLTDPEKIHDLAIWALAIVSRIKPLRLLLQKFLLIDEQRLAVSLGNLKLKNPVGLAAGFDKNIRAPRAYAMLGFGFAEMGSVTFFAQKGNPKPRLWRIPKDKGLIVYYGLANDGAAAAGKRLAENSPRAIPLGASIAPANDLAIDKMADDYIKTLLTLYQNADYITLNVSCPNVAASDAFSQIGFIEELIVKVKKVVTENKIEKDIFVKIGPDMAESDLDKVVDICLKNDITGIIATNLIKNRSSIAPLSALEKLNHLGGISGGLVKNKSTAAVRRIYQRSGGKLIVIGLGGIFTAEDAYEKIKNGASAVQIFTGFIYEGPLAVWRINKGLVKLLRRDGYESISAAVGADQAVCKKELV